MMKKCMVCDNPVRNINVEHIDFDLCDECWFSWLFADTSYIAEWKVKRRVELSTRYLEEALEEV